MKNLGYLMMLIFSTIMMCILLWVIRRQKNKKQIYYSFLWLIILMLSWTISLIAQILCQNTSIPPVCFEYAAAFGGCFLSVAFFFFAMIFSRTKIKFQKWYILLFIIPTISCIMLWTNDFHHLFYKNYSISLNETEFGAYDIVHVIFTYLLYAIDIIYLLRYTIKNAGFFSKQSILIIIGSLIPIIISIFGNLYIIPMTVYVTPICFTFTIMFFSLAIFKFKFLSMTPIAMQRVVDRMSDSFLVISEDGIITDFNETLLKTFHLKAENVRNVDFIQFARSHKLKDFDTRFINSILEKSKKTSETILVKREMPIKNKYFNIEASGIFSKNSFLGTLVLLKDVTQHMEDMETIRNNENMLMERERLASLGQLIGGIAHNLKTPIMSIAGAAEGLSDLIKEYEASVGDPEVTVEDHHDIAKDMSEWIVKIKEYTEYMSDVITAVKGQAVTMSDEQAVSFTLDELVKRVNILMRHELKNALVTLNVSMKVDENTTLKGNINSLVQVMNNMVSNSIQAYHGEPDKDINLTLQEKDNMLDIAIQDFGEGLPEEVQKKLFKEMITTKGKNGTGLGLFMSYSTIRAHFNGNITFETKKGKGTTFHILLPVEQ